MIGGQHHDAALLRRHAVERVEQTGKAHLNALILLVAGDEEGIDILNRISDFAGVRCSRSPMLWSSSFGLVSDSVQRVAARPQRERKDWSCRCPAGHRTDSRAATGMPAGRHTTVYRRSKNRRMSATSR